MFSIFLVSCLSLSYILFSGSLDAFLRHINPQTRMMTTILCCLCMRDLEEGRRQRGRVSRGSLLTSIPSVVTSPILLHLHHSLCCSLSLFLFSYSFYLYCASVSSARCRRFPLPSFFVPVFFFVVFPSSLFLCLCVLVTDPKDQESSASSSSSVDFLRLLHPSPCICPSCSRAAHHVLNIVADLPRRDAHSGRRNREGEIGERRSVSLLCRSAVVHRLPSLGP